MCVCVCVCVWTPRTRFWEECVVTRLRLQHTQPPATAAGRCWKLHATPTRQARRIRRSLPLYLALLRHQLHTGCVHAARSTQDQALSFQRSGFLWGILHLKVTKGFGRVGTQEDRIKVVWILLVITFSDWRKLIKECCFRVDYWWLLLSVWTDAHYLNLWFPSTFWSGSFNTNPKLGILGMILQSLDPAGLKIRSQSAKM